MNHFLLHQKCTSPSVIPSLSPRTRLSAPPDAENGSPLLHTCVLCHNSGTASSGVRTDQIGCISWAPFIFTWPTYVTDKPKSVYPSRLTVSQDPFINFYRKKKKMETRKSSQIKELVVLQVFFLFYFTYTIIQAYVQVHILIRSLYNNKHQH